MLSEPFWTNLLTKLHSERTWATPAGKPDVLQLRNVTRSGISWNAYFMNYIIYREIFLNLTFNTIFGYVMSSDYIFHIVSVPQTHCCQNTKLHSLIEKLVTWFQSSGASGSILSCTNPELLDLCSPRPVCVLIISLNLQSNNGTFIYVIITYLAQVCLHQEIIKNWTVCGIDQL